MTTVPSSPTEPAIVVSWRRTRSTGLSPTVALDCPQISAINLDSSLFQAAKPVLGEMGNQFVGERLSVMLIDNRARILTTVNGCRATQVATEHFGAVPGATWREDTTGTNALATAFETRQRIFIRGRQHYVDSLKDYSCYGAPILHPLTGRLEGVLDVMSDAGSEHALMRPFVDTAVEQIQQRLKQRSGGQTLALMSAFQAAATHPAAIVLGLSPTMTLQTAAAAQLLSPTDLRVLHELAGELRTDTAIPLPLTNGRHATAQLEKVDNSDGVLVRLQSPRSAPVPRRAEPLDRNGRLHSWIERFRTAHRSAIIVGEAGTGRSAALTQAAGARKTFVIHAKDREPDHNAVTLREHLERHRDDIVVIDDLDRLSRDCLGVIEDILTAGTCRILASSAPPRSDNSLHARILTLFPLRLDVPPLRELRHELFAILAELAGPGVPYRFTAQASAVLESYSWPGNRTELAAVLEALAGKRGMLIDLPDLPSHIRRRATTKQLTPWKRASCDAILNALDITHGNKAHAADYLGISRSTLYHHIREYGIHA